MSIFRVQEDFVESIRRSQNKFIEQYIEKRMNQADIRLVDRIYAKDKVGGKVTGMQALEICKELQRKARSSILEQGEKLEEYKYELENTYKYITSLKEHYLVGSCKKQKKQLKNSQVLRLKGNKE